MVEAIADTAATFFRQQCKRKGFSEDVVKTIIVDNEDSIRVPGSQQIDVVLMLPDGREIEVGSYGARRTSFTTWIFGTGVAEPRLSKTMKELQKV